MSWLYYGPAGALVQITDVGWSTITDPRETVGARQLELLLRVRSSSTGTLVLPHNRERDVERMAARRLVLRGLLHEPNVMGGREYRGRRQYLYFYALTERGRTAWLRVRS